MRGFSRWPFLFALGALLLLACQVDPTAPLVPTATPNPTPTRTLATQAPTTPQPTATPASTSTAPARRDAYPHGYANTSAPHLRLGERGW